MALPSPDGRFVLCTGLGTDRVHVYAFDPVGGRLTAHQVAELPPGRGPRHLAFHPSHRYAHLLNELSSTLTVCTWDAACGRLGPGAELPVRGADRSAPANYPAAVLLPPRRPLRVHEQPGGRHRRRPRGPGGRRLARPGPHRPLRRPLAARPRALPRRAPAVLRRPALRRGHRLPGGPGHRPPLPHRGGARRPRPHLGAGARPLNAPPGGAGPRAAPTRGEGSPARRAAAGAGPIG